MFFHFLHKNERTLLKNIEKKKKKFTTVIAYLLN